MSTITTTRKLGIYTATDDGPWTSQELPIPDGTVRLIDGRLYCGSRSRYEDLFLDLSTAKPKPRPILYIWRPIKRRWFDGWVP